MFVNLTPHQITVLGPDGSSTVIEPSGVVARVATTRTLIGEVEGLPVYKAVFGEVTDLPEPKFETTYVVSAQVGQAAKRPDVLSPGDLARGADGQPVGCHGLTAWV